MGNHIDASKSEIEICYQKLAHLEEIISRLGSGAIAFSGGIDSTFLATIAVRVLGDKALLLTAESENFPQWERSEAGLLAKRFGWPHRFVSTTELALPAFRENPPDRCYHCKKLLFTLFQAITAKEGLNCLMEGSIRNDLDDFRPGRRAVLELGVQSPLLEAGFNKREIRILSREFKLPTANKPSNACLSSRIPYGEAITVERLNRIEKAEDLLHSREITKCRVRDHNGVARVEVDVTDIPRLAGELREEVSTTLQQLGFSYVTLDLTGFRSGSMNEVLR